MTQGMTKGMSGRALAVARRKAMSGAGKVAIQSQDRVRVAKSHNADAAPVAEKSCGCGCKEKSAEPATPMATQARRNTAHKTRRPMPTPTMPTPTMNVGRAASLARRKAQSGRGKAGLNGSDLSAAQSARVANPQLSGRELAQALRNQRSKNGSAGQKKSAPTGRQRPNQQAAKDQPWKVGASETSHGQTVTGTQVGRSTEMTGDEASTCRAITGTEYMGADIFRDFCKSEPAKSVLRTGMAATNRGNAVSGSRVGRSAKVTGDEPGTCTRVTGTEYVSDGQGQDFCSANGNKVTRSGGTAKARPNKNSPVRTSNVTGNESGADRALTGTQYNPSSHLDAKGKVRMSRTLQGETVTGSVSGRTARVTGDEPGTCTAVTGTPYAGAEQFETFCEAPAAGMAMARAQKRRNTAASMTGIQPAIGGKMTGDGKGACETISGTPYVGADQQSAACPAVAAEPGSTDFPKSLDGQAWGQFSISSPNHAAAANSGPGGITGSGLEKGQITGPFGMAAGKVTGTEEARFGRAPDPVVVPAAQPQLDGRVKSRITGEGMDAGPKITGDDWDRGDRVTGTEGPSARRRNPTLRGAPMGAMAAMPAPARNEDTPEPVSKVTGSSGNTEKGALITYSGGARG